MHGVQVLGDGSTEHAVGRVNCKVKWFNLQKGYGFLAPLDGSVDVFMHFSVLEQAGYKTVSTGDEVVCEVGVGRCGVQATKVLEIRTELLQNDGVHSSLGNLEEHCGTVKWFNTLKGYGFIQPDDGGRDIFVHTALIRGLEMGRLQLPPGQRVRVKVLSNERGREAQSISFITKEDDSERPKANGCEPRTIAPGGR